MGIRGNRAKKGVAHRIRRMGRALLESTKAPFVCCFTGKRIKMLAKTGTQVAARASRRASKTTDTVIIPQEASVRPQGTAEVGPVALARCAPLLLTSCDDVLALVDVIQVIKAISFTPATVVYPLDINSMLQALPAAALRCANIAYLGIAPAFSNTVLPYLGLGSNAAVAKGSGARALVRAAPAHQPLLLTFPGYGYELPLPVINKPIFVSFTVNMVVVARSCAASASTAAFTAHQPLLLTYPGYGYELPLPVINKPIFVSFTVNMVVVARSCAASASTAAFTAHQPLLLTYPGYGYELPLPVINKPIFVRFTVNMVVVARSCAAPASTAAFTAHQPLLLTYPGFGYKKDSLLTLKEALFAFPKVTNLSGGRIYAAAARSAAVAAAVALQPRLALTYPGFGYEELSVSPVKAILVSGVIPRGMGSIRAAAAIRAGPIRMAPRTKTLATVSVAPKSAPKSAPATSFSPRDLEILRVVLAPGPRRPFTSELQKLRNALAQMAEEKATGAAAERADKVAVAAAAKKAAAAERADKVRQEEPQAEEWSIAAGKGADDKATTADITSTLESQDSAPSSIAGDEAADVAGAPERAAAADVEEQEGVQGEPTVDQAPPAATALVLSFDAQKLPDALYLRPLPATARASWENAGFTLVEDTAFFAPGILPPGLGGALERADACRATAIANAQKMDSSKAWTTEEARNVFLGVSNAIPELVWALEIAKTAALIDATKGAALGEPRRAVPLPEWFIKAAVDVQLPARRAIAAAVQFLIEAQAAGELAFDDGSRMGTATRTAFGAVQMLNAALPQDFPVTAEHAAAIAAADAWITAVMYTPDAKLTVPYFKKNMASLVVAAGGGAAVGVVFVEMVPAPAIAGGMVAVPKERLDRPKKRGRRGSKANNRFAKAEKREATLAAQQAARQQAYENALALGLSEEEALAEAGMYVEEEHME